MIRWNNFEWDKRDTYILSSHDPGHAAKAGNTNKKAVYVHNISSISRAQYETDKAEPTATKKSYIRQSNDVKAAMVANECRLHIYSKAADYHQPEVFQVGPFSKTEACSSTELRLDNSETLSVGH